ncbi:MAG TPA: serine/threonine-protein kinase [Methylibium sp.]|uniref:serine/threonine-protein kinase n=1 Tax=Methylibium sp. TaxID=2067992 RepID=UPI002DBD8773|nr:serine/threonine-protein kinase [Methylibium sp.]HEU4457714.1 serine/threonine-protein kinase [Methylibium sp.]
MAAVLQAGTARPSLGALHPARLGKYELLGIVGVGAMGTVYQGIDPLLQRPVAVKAIHPHLLRDPASDLSVTDRFRNEAQAAGRLSHPGIVPVYEYGEDDRCAFIAMEFVRGLTLSRFLAASGPLSEDEVLSIAVQLLEALHHAHEQGVWHRDIKPGNLMLTADGCVKVTDFGIARLASTALLPASPHTELLVGSPGYIAPERYAGVAPDRRVDIFSCGVLLHQLLSGAPPFAGSASEVMFQVMHRDPPPASQSHDGRGPGNPAFDAVVLKALARRPGDRYATALELRDALLGVAMRPVSRRLRLTPARQAWIGDGGTAPGAAAGSRGAPSRAQRLVVVRSAAAPRPRGAMPAAEATHPSAPANTGSAGPRWPPALLGAIEDALIDALGPIARVLVPRTAAGCADLPTLMHSLAAEGLSAQEQQAFFAAVRQRLAREEAVRRAPNPAAAAPAPQPLPRHEPPLLEDAATLVVLWPATIERAQALLTAHLGPVAALLMQRALARRGDRDGFFLALADEAEGCIDRRGLLKALQRLA